MKICPKDGNVGFEHQNFCEKCGSRFEPIPCCSNCGECLPPFKRFCNGCGLPRDKALEPKPPSPAKPGLIKRVGKFLREYFND